MMDSPPRPSGPTSSNEDSFVAAEGGEA